MDSDNLYGDSNNTTAYSGNGNYVLHKSGDGVCQQEYNKKKSRRR